MPAKRKSTTAKKRVTARPKSAAKKRATTAKPKQKAVGALKTFYLATDRNWSSKMLWPVKQLKVRAKSEAEAKQFAKADLISLHGSAGYGAKLRAQKTPPIGYTWAAKLSLPDGLSKTIFYGIKK